MAYTKFSDIDFPRKEYSIICKNLLRDIQTLETQVMLDEEYIEYLANKTGVDTSKLKFVNLNQQVLYSLKTAFWYYSGKDPADIIMDTSTPRGEKEIDIFNPLDYK